MTRQLKPRHLLRSQPSAGNTHCLNVQPKLGCGNVPKASTALPSKLQAQPRQHNSLREISTDRLFRKAERRKGLFGKSWLREIRLQTPSRKAQLKTHRNQPAGKATSGVGPVTTCLPVCENRCHRRDRRRRGQGKGPQPDRRSVGEHKLHSPARHGRALGREYPPSPRQDSQTERRRPTLHRRGGAQPGLPCPTRRAVAVPSPLQERPHALTESSGALAVPLPRRRGTRPPRAATGRGAASLGLAAPRSAPPVPVRAAAAPHGRTSAGAEDPRPTPAPDARAEGGDRAAPALRRNFVKAQRVREVRGAAILE